MRALAIVLCAWVSMVQAQPSCIESAKDRAGFEECAQKEILPLEAAVVSRVAALRNKYRSDAEMRAGIEKSEEAWNAYRNSHCALEARSRGREVEMEVQRVFAACAKRMLESRLKELDSL